MSPDNRTGRLWRLSVSGFFVQPSDSMRNQRAVLVLGSHRQSLAVIRGLAAAGTRVVFGYPATSGPGFVGHSRWVDALWPHPAFDSRSPTFIEALRAYLDAHPTVRFVFPV